MHIIKTSSNLITKKNYLLETDVEFLFDNGQRLFSDIEVTIYSNTEGDNINVPREEYINKTNINISEIFEIGDCDLIELTTEQKKEIEALIKEFVTQNIE